MMNVTMRVIWNGPFQFNMLIDKSSTLDGYRHHFINTTNHIGADGNTQTFYQVHVVTNTESSTYHDSFFTEWFLIDNKSLYIACDEYGECGVDFSDEYEGETFALAPWLYMDICANEKDESYATQVAKYAQIIIQHEFNIDVSQLLTIRNVGR